MRAGRFDRQIHVELPDLNERRDIFNVHLRPLKKLSADVTAEYLAKQTPGFSVITSYSIHYTKLYDEETFKKVSVDISVKLRLGYNTHKEILDIIPILNELPVSEIILHPRIGKDLYKNEARYEHFKAVQDISAKKLSYNGDIENLSRYINLRSMLGNSYNFV